MHILVIDDDELAGAMVAAVLESLGHQSLLASNAIEGWEQLEAHPEIELLISDMNMPLMSGIELFRELRASGNNLPFILLTGDDPDQFLAKNAYLFVCLRKDFDLEASLPLKIEQLLRCQSL